MLFDDKGECVFKPLHLNEYSFYKLLRKRIEKSPKFPKHFFPKFYGTMYLPSSDPNSPKHYIILENLTQGLKRPCICDLKVGGNSFGTDPHAGILKYFKQTLVKKVSTSGTLSFRMEGMKSWRPNSNSYVSKTKMECKLLSEQSLLSVLRYTM